MTIESAKANLATIARDLVPPPVAARREQAERQLGTLFGRLIGQHYLVLSWRPKGAPANGALPSDCQHHAQVATLIGRAMKHAAAGSDVWIRTTTIGRAVKRGRGTAEDTAAMVAFILDLDVGKEGCPETIEIAREALRKAFPLQPTMIIGSGHGMHCYWCLEKPITDLNVAKGYMGHKDIKGAWKEFILSAFDKQGYHLDRGAFDLARILRLAGTVNYKDPEHPTPVVILEHDADLLYGPDDIDQYLVAPVVEEPVPAPEPTQQAKSAATVSESDEVILEKARTHRKTGAKFRALYDQGNLTAYDSDHSSADCALIEMLGYWTNYDQGATDRLFRSSALMRDKWADREDYRDRTFAKAWQGKTAYVKGQSKRKGKTSPAADKTTADPDWIIEQPETMRFTEHFYNRNCISQGRKTLRRYNQEWYAYSGHVWRVVPDEVITARLWRHFDKCLMYKTNRQTGEKNLVRVAPNRNLIAEVLSALPSYTSIVTGDLPQWTGPGKESRPDPKQMLACTNGILNLDTRELIPSTPDYFNVNAVPYAYDPEAPRPTHWLRFLLDLWGDDLSSPDLLQEWFGYCLLPDMSHDKMLLLYGPPRSGKGTIARVLTALIGEGNMAAATLAGLALPFGLQPFVGKTLAVISDARISGRSDQAIITERLLNITGRDRVTVERKYLPAIPQTVLPIKFLMLTNELPKLTDASAALASRMLLLQFEKSYLGREDKNMEKRILQELPSILNWAIEGWIRLQERGHFSQPRSGDKALRDLQELQSPVKAFVREECVVDDDATIDKDRLYQAWCDWCKATGKPFTGDMRQFGRDLHAAVTSITRSQPKTKDGSRRDLYRGIRLKTYQDRLEENENAE